MSGGGWGLVGSEIWRPFHKMKKFWKIPFLGPGAEFPYLGIISQYEPISARECNIYIIYESWVRKSSCDSRYARKLDFSYYAQIWKFDPRLPKMEFFKKNSFFWKGFQISLPTSPQPPPPDIKFKSSYARKRDYAQIWKFSPRLPKIEFFKKNHFFENVFRFRFQRE